VLCLLALAVALGVWAVASGGGSGGKGSGAPAGSHTPVATITAGPAPSGTHISGRPGGRDTAPGDASADGGTSGGGSDGAGGGTAGDTSAGAGGSGGDTAGDSSAGGNAGTSSGGSGASGSAGGVELPVGSPVPDCAPNAVQVASVHPQQNSYGPTQTPKLDLTVTNTSGVTCKVDFGPTQAVFTITRATDNSHVWASDDCGKPATHHLLQVPAHGSTTYTLDWNEKTSAPNCASPSGKQAALNTTYLVSAQVAGHTTKASSFALSAD
jgi:hypothetical protein